MCLHGKFRKNNKFNITAFYVCMVIQNKEPEAWQNFPVLLSGQLDIVPQLGGMSAWPPAIFCPGELFASDFHSL